MHANKNILLSAVQSILILLLSSCSFVELPAGTTSVSESEQAPQGAAAAQRFNKSGPEGPTAVESAIELSKKHAKLSEDATALRLKNQNLVVENRKLRNEVAALETQLRQAQQELTEANDLLREMLVELNNWKTDVIGFRDEMRTAEKAHLEALLKVLKVLGGEVVSDSDKDEDTTSSAAAAGEPTQLQSGETASRGEENE
ncbi:MAG: hypothetical protein ACYS76_00070 [Planctomycetota bacterium]